MGRVVELSSDIPITDIRNLRRRTQDVCFKNRLKIVEKKLEHPSWTSDHIADELMVSGRHVRQILISFKASGIDGLQPGQPGRNKGDVKYPDCIFDSLLAEIDKHEGVWSGPRMQRYLEETEGLTIALTTIYDRVHKRKYSCKTGRPIPEKGDREAQDKFRAEGIATPIAALVNAERPPQKPLKFFC